MEAAAVTQSIVWYAALEWYLHMEWHVPTDIVRADNLLRQSKQISRGFQVHFILPLAGLDLPNERFRKINESFDRTRYRAEPRNQLAIQF